MPTPDFPGQPRGAGTGLSDGDGRRSGEGTCAARAAESATRPAKAAHNRQRFGKVSPRRSPRDLPDRAELAKPKGWPQRAHTMRPAKPRSAFTAQLPQLGQAMGCRTPGRTSMVPPFLDSTLVLTHRESQVVPLQGSGSASGFPSPAEDYEEGRIDLNRELIRSPLSTFFMRVRGTAMRDEGIVNGDLLVIDRSLNPRAGCLVVAVFEGHFIVRRLRCGPKGQRDLQLEARDGQSRPIPLETGQGSGAELWGVVVHTVHHLNRQGDSPRRRAKLRRQEGGRMGP